MNDKKKREREFFDFKIVQGRNLKRFELTEENLAKKFKALYFPLIKELNLKKRNAFLCDDSGRMLSNLDLNLSLEEIIEKFGHEINLHSESVR